jgi:Domain of unknown function (DUF4276)
VDFGTATISTHGDHMHFEILVEDISGKAFLDIAMPKLIHRDHTFHVHSYKGIGRIPRNLNKISDVGNRILLDQLPRLLKGYGKAFSTPNYKAAVIVVCDVDNRNPKNFYTELMAILDACSPKPNAFFCLAIEEGEAWLLGDIKAIKNAYPTARDKILREYVNDSICGTWERLADAVFPGGAQALAKQGWQAVGAEKSRWASAITPSMNFNENRSPSFHEFQKKVLELDVQEENTM